MNYINKGKRDILIFPKFNNIELIQEIRNKYDELSQILPPHITLAFPFKLDMDNQTLNKRLLDICKGYDSFKIRCKGINFVRDIKINKYYIFLNINEGADVIFNISKDIYNKLLNKEIPNNYVPHITLGTIDEIAEINFNYEFETIVNEVVVESIAENEKSIIEFCVKLD